jgi:uncharacterized integral membrane protein
MLAVILILIIAVIVAFFAGQNTVLVTINILTYSREIPLYLVVLVSLLIGFVLAWILHLMNAFASLFALRGKDNVIKKEKKVNTELTKKVQGLEIEKTKLETEKSFRSSRLD